MKTPKYEIEEPDNDLEDIGNDIDIEKLEDDFHNDDISERRLISEL